VQAAINVRSLPFHSRYGLRYHHAIHVIHEVTRNAGSKLLPQVNAGHHGRKTQQADQRELRASSRQRVTTVG